MAEYYNPGAAYTSRFSAGVANTGLVGTIRYRLLDADATANDPVYGPSTAGIIEDPSGSGDYQFSGTAPTTEGKYFPAWDLGSGQLYYDDDIVVTRSAAVPFVASGHEYVTRDELKVILKLQGTDFADDAIDIAVEAASRACDGYRKTHFYPSANETRYYSADPFSAWLDIDDLSQLDSLTLDLDGDGTYETTWAENTEFSLYPRAALANGLPWNRISRIENAVRRFPSRADAVKVVGTFGWATTPALVKQATILLANRLLKRTTQAPLGVLVATANETVAVARLGSIDPDAKFLLDQLPGGSPPISSIPLS